MTPAQMDGCPGSGQNPIGRFRRDPLYVPVVDGCLDDEAVTSGTWTPVSTRFFRDARVQDAGPEAALLFLAACCWCQEQLSDGVIPERALRVIAAEAMVDDAFGVAARLVEVGLWDRSDSGWVVGGWLDWNRSKAEVEERQERRRESQRAWRDRSRDGRGDVAEMSRRQSPRQSRDDLATPPHTHTHTQTHTPSLKTNARSDDAFDAFWKLYPRKVGKPKAVAAYRNAARRAAPETILAGLTKWVAVWAGTEPQFIPHPTTWLNRDGWNDTPTPAKPLDRGAAMTGALSGYLNAGVPAIGAGGG